MLSLGSFVVLNQTAIGAPLFDCLSLFLPKKPVPTWHLVRAQQKLRPEMSVFITRQLNR